MPPARPRALGWLLALFFLSGFSALIYEVVWLRMLVRAFGNTTYATSNVLAIFMAGLAIGSAASGRWAARLRSPLRAYALVESLLALSGIACTVLAARLPTLFAHLSPAGPADSLSVLAARSCLAASALILPTVLMGATLPLLAEHGARPASGTGGLSWDLNALLYGLNTLGAVAGVAFSGFYTLGSWGETRTIALAVAGNLAVGALALALAAALPRAAPPGPAAPPALSRPRPAVLWWMAVSGFCALGAEVLWSRLLVLLTGTSIYAFSAMLSLYLLGLAAGSLACGRWLARARNLPRAFAVLQLAAGFLIFATFQWYFHMGMARTAGEYLISPLLSAGDFVFLFQAGAAVVLPVTLCYGALFPLAVRLADADGSGNAVGRVYAANTVGAVAGSLATAFLLIPRIATHNAVYLLAALHLALSIAVLLMNRQRPLWGWTLPAFALLALAAGLRIDPFAEIVRERLLRQVPDGAIAFHREGAAATVTGFDMPDGSDLLLLNGIVVSGKNEWVGFMAHLPLLIQERPGRAAIIGLGAGNALRAAVDHGVAVDVAELEPVVLERFLQAWPDARTYLDRPSVRIVFNDGRNFLLTAGGTYDAIVVDGSPPIFSAGAVNLYSKEFLALARSRLSPSGILALWVPSFCFESDFWTIARAFTEAFPHAGAYVDPRLPGVLLLGSRSPWKAEPDLMARRALARGLTRSTPWLDRSAFNPSRLLRDHALRERSRAYPALTDDRPTTEFPLPRFLRQEPLRTDRSWLLAR